MKKQITNVARNLGLKITAAIFIIMLTSIQGWGQTTSITITNSSIGGSAVLGSNNYNGGAERTWTQSSVNFGGKAITCNPVNTPTGSSACQYIQAQASNGVIYNTSALPGRLVSVRFIGTASVASSLYGGTSRLVNTTTADYSVNGGTQIGTAQSSTDYTWTTSASDNYTYFCIKRGTSAQYFSSIVITYETPISAPTTQAQNITFSSVTTSGMKIDWTNGNGSSRAVFVKEGSGSITNPVDGTTYTASSDWNLKGTQLGSSGYYCVYNGTGNSVTLTNLAANTAYYVQVFEYNGSGTTSKYNTSTTTGNPNSQSTQAATTPTITVTGNLNAFAATVINTTSSEQSYTVEGSNLTDSITITSPTGFEISTGTGANFSATNPITLTQSGGTVSQTIIYVRFAPTAVQSYSGNITHTSNGATQIYRAVSGTGIYPEPTNHATSFEAVTGTPTYSAIIVGWTDATGGQVPAGYLIKGSSVGYNSITNPVDGTPESDGVLVKNIAQGNGIYEFTGLNPSTTYYFKIYPYTNSGSNINYKTDGIVPTASATTDAQPWTEDFETGIKASYTAGNVTCSKGSWNLSEALIGNGSSDRKNGLQSVRLRYTSPSTYGEITMNFDKTNGAGNVTIYHALYGADVSGSWKLQMSADGGNTWYDVGDTVNTTSTTLTAQNFSVNQSGNVRFKIIQLSGNRINIDDIIITNYTSSPATTTFNGNLSNAWEITANWDNGTPVSTSNVIIPAGKNVIVNSNNECNNLTVESTSSLTINSGKTLTVNGSLLLKSDNNGTASFIDNGTVSYNNATFERYIPANLFYMVAMPISNTISAGTNAGQTGDVFKYCTLDSYNEASNSYTGLTASNDVTPDKGYVVKYVAGNNAPNFKVISFSGSLNTGTINIPVTKNSDGYNLIPNPYPSSIDWNAASGWTKNSENNTTYIYSHSQSQWSQFDGSTGIHGASRYIAPGQSFFVKVSSAGNITMNNNVRVHNATTLLKSSNNIVDNLIKLRVSGDANSIKDETVVYFANNPASSGSEKWFSYEPTAPSLYTVKNNQNYAINILPDANTTVAVTLAFKAGANGNYTIDVAELGNFTLCSTVILEDLFTGSTHNLLANPAYSFTANTTDNVNRFVLHFASAVGTGEISKTNSNVYSYENNIYVNTNESIKKVNIYNAIGQLVKSVYNVNGLLKIDMHEQPTGYYIVNVVTDNGVANQKVLIK